MKNKDSKTNKPCNIDGVKRSTSNIEIAIKHFERRHNDEKFKHRVSTEEVLKVLHFLKQSNEQELDMIGIGYTRYDGGDIKDCGVENMYEKGFLVRK